MKDASLKFKKHNAEDVMSLSENIKRFFVCGFMIFFSIVLFFFCRSQCKQGAVLWNTGLAGGSMGLLLLFFYLYYRLKQEILFWKKETEKLRHNESRFRMVFELNPIQTIIVDKDARIIMHNFAGKKNHGALPVTGEVLYKDYAAKHQMNMYDALMNCIRKNRHQEFSEIRYKERYLNINIAPFSDGAIVTLIDVTDRCLLADELQQARKMEAIGTLAGGVAHDFNNLLSIILGNMELALDEVPQWSSARNNLQEIQTAGLRAREVVRQLLSFSRKTHVSKVAVDIREIVHESEHLLRSSIPSTIDIRKNMPETLSPIKADATQMQQIVINLCTNAAHAMEGRMEGRLTISLEDVVVDQMHVAGFGALAPGRYVMLQVIDTGQGIDDLTRKKLFDPYFTTKAVGKGTGMGLFVVQGIVKNHDGAVRVESFPDQGTTVSVFLPVTDEIPAQTQCPTSPLSQGTETLLVVDDEISLVNIARAMLTPLGYRVKGTTFPLEALAMFQSDPTSFDLVITDMTMPRMSGEELAGKIMEIRPQVPIILCTGLARKITRGQLREMGISRCIEKPLDRGVLSTTVRQVLDEAAGES